MHRTASLASPPGRGAIAIIDLRGPDLASGLRDVFEPFPSAGTARHGAVRDRVGGTIDDGILLPLAPDRALLTVHGNPLLVDAVLERLSERGWRVEPTGASIDAELATIAPLAQRAPTVRAGLFLIEQERRWRAWAGRGPVPAPQEIRAVLERRGAVRAFEVPPRVVLLGPPNAGKSTLLNRLLGTERVVVSEVAGTTRDRIEVAGVLGDRPVRWVDGAGLREGAGPLEAEGIRRILGAAAGADLVVRLLARDLPVTPLPEGIAAPLLVVGTKADLGGAAAPEVELAISARTGEGLEQFRGAVAGILFGGEDLPGETCPITEDRAAALRALLERIEVSPAPDADEAWRRLGVEGEARGD